MAKFSDLVTQFCRETPERMDAVFALSVQKTISVMQTPVGAGGNMPVDTGFLRNSLAVNLGTTPPAITLQRNPGTGVFTYDPSASNLDIKAEEGATAVYSADYAIYAEFGARGRPGRRFVALAVQQWPQIVSRSSRELENRVRNG